MLKGGDSLDVKPRDFSYHLVFNAFCFHFFRDCYTGLSLPFCYAFRPAFHYTLCSAFCSAFRSAFRSAFCSAFRSAFQMCRSKNTVLIHEVFHVALVRLALLR